MEVSIDRRRAHFPPQPIHGLIETGKQVLALHFCQRQDISQQGLVRIHLQPVIQGGNLVWVAHLHPKVIQLGNCLLPRRWTQPIVGLQPGLVDGDHLVHHVFHIGLRLRPKIAMRIVAAHNLTKVAVRQVIGRFGLTDRGLTPRQGPTVFPR